MRDNTEPEARQAGRYGKASFQIDTTPTQFGMKRDAELAQTLLATIKLLFCSSPCLRTEHTIKSVVFSTHTINNAFRFFLHSCTSRRVCLFSKYFQRSQICRHPSVFSVDG